MQKRFLVILSEVKPLERKPFQVPNEWKEKWTSLCQKHNKYETFHPEIQKILIRPRIPTQSPEWELERKVRISATNTSAILGRTPLRGKSKWMTYDDLLLIKTSRKKETPSSFVKTAMNHGLAHEEEAAQAYCESKWSPKTLGCWFIQNMNIFQLLLIV